MTHWSYDHATQADYAEPYPDPDLALHDGISCYCSQPHECPAAKLLERLVAAYRQVDAMLLAQADYPARAEASDTLFALLDEAAAWMQARAVRS